MSRSWKLVFLAGASLALPFTITSGGQIAVNDARCDEAGGTCCQQEEAACTDAFPTPLIGYYNKGCAGECGKECPQT